MLVGRKDGKGWNKAFKLTCSRDMRSSKGAEEACLSPTGEYVGVDGMMHPTWMAVNVLASTFGGTIYLVLYVGSVLFFLGKHDWRLFEGCYCCCPTGLVLSDKARWVPFPLHVVYLLVLSIFTPIAAMLYIVGKLEISLD